MRDAFDDEETGSRPVLWVIFGVLVVATILAVAFSWRNIGLDRWLTVFDGIARTSDAAPVIHAANVGAPSVDVGERIGDWFVSCGGATRDCALTQTNRQAGIPAASWRIERTRAGDLVGVWTMPTGVMIGRGMNLALDGGAPSVVPYDSCAQSSCEVRAKLGPDFVELMQAAAKTGATVTLKGGVTQSYEFSHNGLAAGLARLAPAAP